MFSTLSQKSTHGRPMAMGKFIWVNRPETLKGQIGAGATFCVHLGYCPNPNCGQHIALNLPDCEIVYGVLEQMLGREPKKSFRPYFASKLTKLIKSVKGKELKVIWEPERGS